MGAVCTCFSNDAAGSGCGSSAIVCTCRGRLGWRCECLGGERLTCLGGDIRTLRNGSSDSLVLKDSISTVAGFGSFSRRRDLISRWCSALPATQRCGVLRPAASQPPSSAFSRTPKASQFNSESACFLGLLGGLPIAANPGPSATESPPTAGVSLPSLLTSDDTSPRDCAS